MRYTAGCRQALEIMRDAADIEGNHWWPEMLTALARVLPGPAISHGLVDESVWNQQRRRQVEAQVRSTIKVSKGGVPFDAFVPEVEAVASGEGSAVVRQRHLALAMAKYRNGIAGLGINVDRLVEVTSLREDSQFPEEALQIAARSDSDEAQMARLEATEGELTWQLLLAMEEREGHVEWKRSILNHRKQQLGVLIDQEKVAVTLINGNPEREVYLAFGVEDNKTVVGQVTQDLKPLTADQVRESQRRFVEQMQSVTLPVRVAWTRLDHPDGQIVVARMRGRRRGTAARTSFKAYPYRSGEDTFWADPATIAGWVAEEDPRLRQLLELRTENDARVAGLLEELVKSQREQAARQRDELFARLDVVGASLSSDGSGSVTVRHRAGLEPGHRIQVWAFRDGKVGVGELDWLSIEKQEHVPLTPVTSRALASGPFSDWADIKLAPGEYLLGVSWRGLQYDTRSGRTAWVMGEDGSKQRRVANEWDEPSR